MSAKDDLDRFESTWPTFINALCRYADELMAPHYPAAMRPEFVSRLGECCEAFAFVERRRLRLAARAEAEATLTSLKDEVADG